MSPQDHPDVKKALKVISDHAKDELTKRGGSVKGVHIHVGYSDDKGNLHAFSDHHCFPDPNNPGQFVCS